MKIQNKIIILLLLLIIPAGYSFAGIEIAPIINATAVGGQYVFISTSAVPGSLGGNINFDVTPAISFSNKLSLVPTVSYNYYGVKDVEELVGGGTLFQRRQDIIGNGKLIYAIGDNFKIKGGGSYKQEYLIETSSETWGNGLFDTTKWSGGGEVEVKLNAKGDSFRAGYDYYQLSFTNYEALVAKYSDEFAELQQTPGDRVLDYNAGDVTVEGGLQFSDNLIVSYNMIYTMKNFPEQYTVNSLGAYSATDLRNDTSLIHNIGTLLMLPVKDSKLLVNLRVQLDSYLSDQNHYDVGKFKYIPKYYDYSSFSINPSAILYLGKQERPSTVSITGGYGTRNYAERLVQDVDGNYGTDKIYTNSISLGISASIPLTENFSFVAQLNFLNKASNMMYETFYKYNYSTFNYFGGISINF